MRLLESKIAAWTAMILVTAMVVMSVALHTPWYGFIAVFFFFIGVFSHLAAIYLRKMSIRASNKLEKCAFIAIILAVLAFIIEYILFL